MLDFQLKDKIHPKQHVKILVKRENGVYSEELYEGVVQEILTESSCHYRGIKVRLTDGTEGRVREILKVRKNK